MKRALLVLAACSTPSGDGAVRIDSVTPAYGPLAGGTRVVIAGDQFTDGHANTTRVLVGGREAPLANPLDDETLEIVVPPGDQPGDAELVVFNRNGTAISSSVFHYAAQPSITSVSPSEAIFNEATAMTLVGSGFLAEGAGEPLVLIDGVPALDVTVTSDTELTFGAPAGRALARPRIELANARGIAVKDRAFRYRPSARSGLLLFTVSQSFALFFDPIDKSVVPIPRIGAFTFISAVVRDEDGEYWGVDRSGGTRLGRLDLGTQRLEQAISIGFRVPAMARIDGVQYGIDRLTQRFGTFGLDGTFTRIGEAPVPCCGSFGLAYDGTTLYIAFKSGSDKVIAPIDRETGVIGTPVKLVGGGPSFQIEDMRFFRGTLYASSRDSTLVTIDPATGAVTIVATVTRANAIEVFD